MWHRRRIYSWLQGVADGEPLHVGIAVVMGLALFGLLIAILRSGKVFEESTLARGHKLRWPHPAASKDRPPTA
ncbi:hypothetical protein PX52LOC_07022 [Limnoglobus roseus]|uniref:Uncharacterized protein n=2 Tax=Limnoglobus roseus TaxID=2598579 RepID=A0A5C1AKN4_9BACT|nr:hypothetical protein PX52LOC_07022 [Limnoglobus roseus]